MGLIKDVKDRSSIEEVARRLGLTPEHQRGRVVCRCPFHSDTHPSMVLGGARFPDRYICRVCPKNPGEGDVIDLVKRVLKLDSDLKAAQWIAGEDARAPIAAPPPKRNDFPVLNEDLTGFAFQARLELSQRARFWLRRRGLTPEVIEDFALGSTDAPGFSTSVLPDYWDDKSGRISKHRNFLNRIVIPYIEDSPNVRFVNARALGEQKPKYLKAQTPHKVQTSPPYLLDALIAEGVDDLWITEGELDALSLYSARPQDIAACAIPGVNGLMDAHLPKFSGRRVWVIADNDDAGRKARVEIERRLYPFARVIHQVHLPPEYNDVNQMLVQAGRKYLAGYIEACIRKAVRRTTFRPF